MEAHIVEFVGKLKSDGIAYDEIKCPICSCHQAIPTGQHFAEQVITFFPGDESVRHVTEIPDDINEPQPHKVRFMVQRGELTKE